MNKRCRLLTVVSWCAVTMWTTYSSAQVIECTDANGKKTFASECPSGTVKQRALSNGGTSALPEGGGQAQPSYKEQDAAFRKRQIEKQEAEAKAKEDYVTALKECSNARGHLLDLKSHLQVGVIDPFTGNRRMLTEEQRVAEIKKAQEVVDQVCKR